VAPFQDLFLAARFARDLPGFLRHPVSVAEATAILARRRAHRAEDFLEVVRRGIYEHARSPYRALLRRAGCELGDLKELVRRDGVEGALDVLARSGVYLTTAEFKGRTPLVRGGETIDCSPNGLRNPASTTHLRGATSGSRGAPVTVPVDLAHVRDWSVNFCLMFDTLGPLRWRHARWSLPGGDGLAFGLIYAGFGAPLTRWFSPVDLAGPGVHARYRWACRLLAWESRLVGVPVPYPEHVPVESPGPILRWLVDTLRAGDTPHLAAYVSPALRLCEAAVRAGVDLQGAYLRLVGEPVTAGRLAAIRRTGIEAVPDYGAVDVGLIGSDCRAPEAPDEVHLYDDLLAVIQTVAAAPGTGLPPATLLFSSLRATAPFVLLNVSLGDQATLTRRTCGCGLERLGWRQHLHTVRSYEKLTAGGMTVLDTDVIRILEDLLPARFGGTPTDYQLVEDQSAPGTSDLRLLVHPRLGPVDPGAVTRLFLETLGAASPSARVMGLAWDGAGLLRVERRVPLATGSGKILHLHVNQPADGPVAGPAPAPGQGR
jgi:hypothetical protein